MTWAEIIEQRPERLEVDEVMALPAGGFPFEPPPGIPKEPLSIHIGDEWAYILWSSGGDRAYWRLDVWRERFGDERLLDA